jgi:hypothetical protein
MEGSFTKQVPRISGKLNKVNDALAGGQITAAPSGLTISAGEQTRPGDRIILLTADALALSDTTVGTLYAGLYMYVKSATTSKVGRLAFVDTSVADGLYQVTGSEAGVTGVVLRAGVYISVITATYYGWIFVSGKVAVQFRTALTGTGANGAGVYAAGENNGVADVLAGSSFNSAVSSNNAAVGYSSIEQVNSRFLGWALTPPSNNNASTIIVPLLNLPLW